MHHIYEISSHIDQGSELSCFFVAVARFSLQRPTPPDRKRSMAGLCNGPI